MFPILEVGQFSPVATPAIIAILFHLKNLINIFDLFDSETREETGYTEKDLKIYKDMMRTLEYEVRGKPKTSVYFVAQLLTADNPVLSEEHTEFRFVPKSDVKTIAPFPDFLQMVEDFDAEIRKLHQL